MDVMVCFCVHSSSLMVQDQAAALHAMGMMGYRELKSRLMSTTAFLVGSGTLIAMSAGGAQAAYPFAVGGFAALGYQWLLQQSVDSIPSRLPRRTLVKVSTCFRHGLSALAVRCGGLTRCEVALLMFYVIRVSKGGLL